MGMVEVQHFGGSVKGLPHIVSQDVHKLQEKLDRALLSIFGRKKICDQIGYSHNAKQFICIFVYESKLMFL